MSGRLRKRKTVFFSCPLPFPSERDKNAKEVIGKRIAYGFAKYMRDALPNATTDWTIQESARGKADGTGKKNFE